MSTRCRLEQCLLPVACRGEGTIAQVVGKATVQLQSTGHPALPPSHPSEWTGKPRSPPFLLYAVPERTL